MNNIIKFSSLKNNITDERLKKIAILAESLMAKQLYQKYGKDEIKKHFAGTGVFENVEKENDTVELLNNKISTLLFKASYEDNGGKYTLVFDKETFLPDFGTANIMKNPSTWSSSFLDKFFTNYETAISPIIQTIGIAFYDSNVKVERIGYGETFKVNVGSNEVFVVDEVGEGTLKVASQRLLNREYVANPRNYGAGTTINYYQMASGKVDWGRHIMAVAEGFMRYWSLMAIDGLAKVVADGVKSGIDTPYFKVTLSDDNITGLIKTLASANNNGDINIYGDLSAVGKLLPSVTTTNNTLLSQLGAEWTKKGYLGTYKGANVYRIDQVILPGTVNTTPLFGAPENILYFANENKEQHYLVFEGDSLSVNRDKTITGDGKIHFELYYRFDMVYVPSAKIGAIVIE